MYGMHKLDLAALHSPVRATGGSKLQIGMLCYSPKRAALPAKEKTLVAGPMSNILAEGAIALSVTLSGGALFAS